METETLLKTTHDFGGQLHCSVVISEIFGNGLLVTVENGSESFSLNLSDNDLITMRLDRSQLSLEQLVNSLEIAVDTATQKSFITTSLSTKMLLPSINSAESFRRYLSAVSSSDHFQDTLVEGLTELCRVKPVGTEAIRWLGTWLLQNNPNRPHVDEFNDE